MSTIEKPVLVLGCLTVIPFLVFLVVFFPALTTIAVLLFFVLYGLVRSLRREPADADHRGDE